MGVLGKRKTPSSSSTSSGKPKPSTSSQDEYAAYLRSHFEAQYEPLPTPALVGPSPGSQEAAPQYDSNPGSNEDSGSEWGGLSDDDQARPGPSEDQTRLSARWGDEENDDDSEQEVEIIDHSNAPITTGQMSKRDQKRFLSSTTNSISNPSEPSHPQPPPPDESSEDAATMIKNDLALSRLLRESHLLSSLHTHISTSRGGNNNNNNNDGISLPFSDRRAKLAATDLRIQALGSNKSIVGHQAQKKMPLAHRRGIVQKGVERELKRRTEAKENGIVLERMNAAAPAGSQETKNSSSSSSSSSNMRKKNKTKREIAVDMPSVGRMRGAELRLSKRDIMEVEGNGGGGGGRGRGSGPGATRGGGGGGGKKRRR